MNKYILIIATCFLVCNLYGQTRTDSMLVNIPVNVETVPSGIIYERVFQFSNLYNFNESADFETADAEFFFAAFNELRMASNDQRFIPLSELKKRADKGNEAENAVNIAIMNSSFEILNYNEKNPEEGGLRLNPQTELFEAITGKPSFFTLHTTLVAPTKTILVGDEVFFKFKDELLFNNAEKQIGSMSIVFGRGLSHLVINDSRLVQSSIRIPYSTSGIKTYTCNIEYNDGTSGRTHGQFYFHANSLQMESSSNGSCTSGDNRVENNTIAGDEEFQGYLPSDPRIFPRLDYRIYYADESFHSDLKIYKPIIIIDGFDPADARQIEDCDCEAIPDCAIKYLKDGIFDPEEHISLRDKMFYTNDLGTPSDVLEELRAQGFDVIVVNHPTYETTNINTGQSVTIDGGAYYIESNAHALATLIKEVNLELTANGSQEQIAIIGPSMGGQTSRYALAYMEKKFAETNDAEWEHNTYLWISVDSPHLGANIPLGDQSLIYLLAARSGKQRPIDTYNNRLGSPASKQQLIELHRNPPSQSSVNLGNLDGRVASQGYSTDEGSEFFRTYYNNQQNNGLLGSDGYPQNLRKISLVNGSMVGTKQTDLGFDFAGNEATVLELYGKVKVCVHTIILGSYCFDVTIAGLGAKFLSRPFEGDKTIAGFGAVTKGNHQVNAPNINSRGNMDNVPGGYFNAQEDILKGVTASSPLFSFNLGLLSVDDYWDLVNYNPIHSFIPSFSAIAHTNPDQNWTNALNYNLICADDTHFDSYFGDEFNSEHTSFTKESTAWLYLELAGQPQLPYYPLDGNDLSGPLTLCKDDIAIYSFGICKTPSTPVWQVSSKLQIISINNDNNSIKIKALDNGVASISATMEGQPEPVNKWIHIGPPVIESVVSVPVTDTDLNDDNPFFGQPICDLVGLTLNFYPNNGIIEEIEWQEVSNNFSFSTEDQFWPDIDFNDSRYALVIPQCNGTITFRARAKNACGWSDWQRLTYNITNACPTNCSGGSGGNGNPSSTLLTDNFTIYPVPADNFLTVTTLNQNYDINNAGQVMTVEIYSNSGGLGQLVASASSAALPVNVDVSNLPIGVYTVVISFNGITESHQINII